MTWPGSSVTITHSYFGLDGSASSGIITFSLSSAIRNGGRTISGNLPYAMVAGILTVTLPCNDDPGTVPQGTSYTVTEAITGETQQEFTIVVLAADNGKTVDLAAYLPSVAGS